jgi:uncharacterized protein YggT (Ycf19 family)
MALIDWLLNIACVLLWLHWRSLYMRPLEPTTPVSLLATLKQAGPRRRGAWVALLSLAGILVIRSFFYWNVGSAVNWTPSLELGVVSLPFRSDYLQRMLVYSGLSFGCLLAGVYAWLLLISIINRKLPKDEPAQRLVRWQLGWVECWPAWAKFLLPLAFTGLVWGMGNPSLVRMGIVPAPVSRGHLWQQALLLGVNSFLSWKLLIVLICGLYLINSYVYLGNSYFWTYVNVTGANLLSPLRRLPLRFGKVDLSPVLLMIVVLAVGYWAARWLPVIFQRLPF